MTVMPDVRELLETASTIELVDWPNQEVPATLDRAGYDVVGHEPDSLKRYTVEAAPPNDATNTFPLADGGVLVCRNIDALPPTVDVVCTHRPPEEQAEIARDAIANGAKAFWVEPPEATAPDARRLVEEAGLVFVDGESIAAAVRRLGISRGPAAG
jgi:predicted CoA-binding protein